LPTHDLPVRSAVLTSVLVGTALLAVPALAVPAQASGGGGVSASAVCATGTIKVKAKADNGRIEVEGEVDPNRAGQTWSWTIRRNGTLMNQGTGTTVAPSGSFTVTRGITNPAGTNTIQFRAVRPATGKVCAVSVRF